VLAHLEIDEVITGASLSTEMSPITESTMQLNHRINLGKREHPCQIEDLNPGVSWEDLDRFSLFFGGRRKKKEDTRNKFMLNST
jgi:hypothetical protein